MTNIYTLKDGDGGNNKTSKQAGEKGKILGTTK